MGNDGGAGAHSDLLQPSSLIDAADYEQKGAYGYQDGPGGTLQP